MIDDLKLLEQRIEKLESQQSNDRVKFAAITKQVNRQMKALIFVGVLGVCSIQGAIASEGDMQRLIFLGTTILSGAGMAIEGRKSSLDEEAGNEFLE